MGQTTALSPRRLERLLQMDQLLRNHGRITQPMLAEKLEVTQRTIRDDLHFLQDRLMAPLDYNKKEGWYYTNSTWRLPSISLSIGELFALTLGARMLQSYAGSAYEKELRSSIERLSERLPEQTWIDLQQLADERIVFRSGAETNLDPEIWQKLLEASRASKRIWIHYYAATRNQYSERVVDPYLLHVYRATNPYVIGFCHKRQEIRWFRIDRIQQIKVLDETFERDPNFKADTYLEKIFQAEVGGHPVTVSIWFDAATAPFIRERRWHVTQEITEHGDGSLTLNLVTSGLNDLKRWVLGYGKGAVVKEPVELVNLVKSEVEGLSQHYKLSTN
ncbi:helix-turn-helix transcriptional regulator [Crocosphaera sp. XPORK-15E]|uniref:helix-turn-helix transcriptional regulator n=1 Tax=Crocosphaera sp. XPORK-15E TaxID=3110247 RepID=UPI002B1F42E6|nr:WYL domain-containing protein [Crocosphaera sp. XPORK-15E]MEA5536915.1 WYL domain-containing protein [Crocosphaera sp. XPORK-15E]